jgi:hypothetical protein
MFINSLFTVLDTSSQEWIRIFEGDTSFMGNMVIEYYDKGYVIAGEKEKSTIHFDGWLCKTDINGFRLWDKSFQDTPARIAFYSVTTTETGDITMIGRRVNNGYHDPIIVKVDACGQKQWCKIYDAVSQYGLGVDIILLPSGGYMALFYNWVDPWENKPMWLFRLDAEGNIIWQQYFPQDSIFWGTSVYRILLSPDSTVILTGESYTPNPGQTSPSWLRPFVAKVDLDGNAVFELSWGRDDYLVGVGFSSVVDLKGNIYTTASHARPVPPYGDSPCLLRTSSEGQEISFIDLIDTTKTGGSGALSWFQDSTMIINGAWKGPNSWDTTINGVFKTDTLGNIIMKKDLFGFTNGFNSCITTFDNKAVLIGPFGLYYPYWQTVMIKLNSGLEYDSIYTRPFTYDSLCPYPIASDTILLDDCEVVVDIDEPIKNPEKTELKIFPNPASQKTTIELPEYLVRVSGGFGFSATTIYHQWKDVRLEVFDLFGKLIFSETVPQHKNSVSLHVSSWSPGMYLARIVFMNEVVAREKFVIN